ncbi:hypothetical protein ACFW1A_05665 [Kitasatospora sp. NPDC058965]|uniref:hypothetical protein n=1 Tax=Kitasatospora sp. NPDC058965 TaxID=3346682 RepID=UPI003675C39E
MLFQVLTEREEKNSVAIASNESFGKAHMFRRTCARRCRSSTRSARSCEPVDPNLQARHRRRKSLRMTPYSAGTTQQV